MWVYIMYLLTHFIIDIKVILISLYFPCFADHAKWVCLHVLAEEILNIFIINFILHGFFALALVSGFKILSFRNKVVILNNQILVTI